MVFKRYIPNGLSLFRIVVVLIFLAVSFSPLALAPVHFLAGLILYWLACSTDLLDGWCARRWGVVSRLGAFLDPLTDKLLHLGTLIALGIPPVLSFYLYGWLFPLEVALFAAAVVGFFKILPEVKFSANWFGKRKVWCEGGLVTLRFAEHLGIPVPLWAFGACIAPAILFASLSLAGKIGLLDAWKK